MDESRLKLSKKLHNLCEYVYFSPPTGMEIQHPCILYELGGKFTRHANNHLYKKNDYYTVTYIDQNPDSKIPDEILQIEYCSFDRSYKADNLYHWVYTIYV